MIPKVQHLKLDLILMLKIEFWDLNFSSPIAQKCYKNHLFFQYFHFAERR